jgi:two-component system KDP operon response regulator KdpE
MKVLVIDDDAATRNVVEETLKTESYSVILAADGREGVNLAVEHKPQVTISDLSLPGMNGLEVCRELRTWYTAPLLILSGYGEERLIVEALDAGADDYIVKPFRPGELLARMRALLRRSQSRVPFRPTVKSGDLEVNFLSRRVFRGGEEIALTRTEFDILACLLENRDCIVTPKMIFEKVWSTEEGNPQTIRVHIGNLRKKIEGESPKAQHIVTAAGVGYRLQSPPR